MTLGNSRAGLGAAISPQSDRADDLGVARASISFHVDFIS
jgi:hypothetical protein